MFVSFTLFLTCAGASHAAELGRLFFTPQERAELEARGGAQNDERGLRNSITVNGVVQKQGGKRTVWVNGAEKAAGQSNNQTPSVVLVDVPGKSQPVYIKVGDKLLLDTPAQEENQ